MTSRLVEARRANREGKERAIRGEYLNRATISNVGRGVGRTAELHERRDEDEEERRKEMSERKKNVR